MLGADVAAERTSSMTGDRHAFGADHRRSFDRLIHVAAQVRARKTVGAFAINLHEDWIIVLGQFRNIGGGLVDIAGAHGFGVDRGASQERGGNAKIFALRFRADSQHAKSQQTNQPGLHPAHFYPTTPWVSIFFRSCLVL